MSTAGRQADIVRCLAGRTSSSVQLVGHRSHVAVIVLCGENSFIRKLMLLAHARGMTGGEYVFLKLELMPASDVETPWAHGNDDDDEVRKAFFPLLQVRPCAV